MAPSLKGIFITALVLSVLLGVASFFDRPIAIWLHDSGFAANFKGSAIARILKLPGEFLLIAVVAVLLLVFHPLGWRAGGLMVLAGVVAASNALFKWGFGRVRPYRLPEELVPMAQQPDPFYLQWFRGGFDGLLVGKNLAFPSGHASLAFAAAAALAILTPNWRYAFYVIAALTAAERVAENAHYLSDVVGAALLGVVGVKLVHYLAAQAVPPPNTEQPQEVGMDASPEAYTTKENGFAYAGATSRQLDHADDAPMISLVIPCYNEQETVPTLLERVGGSLQEIEGGFEVIIVDDGSKDDTPKLLAEGMQKYGWLRVLRMGKNGGQSAAFDAGFRAAKGRHIATIDADLQNDPEEIPRLLKILLEEQVDMVTGWRKDRQDTGFRRFQTRFANRIRNWISQETIQDSASSLKVYKRECLVGIQMYNGMHRFMPTLVKLRGFKVLETPVKHSKRFAGTAKYGFRNRAFRAFIDLLAVRWMKKRYLNYTCAEVSPSRGQDSPS